MKTFIDEIINEMDKSGLGPKLVELGINPAVAVTTRFRDVPNLREKVLELVKDFDTALTRFRLSGHPLLNDSQFQQFVEHLMQTIGRAEDQLSNMELLMDRAKIKEEADRKLVESGLTEGIALYIQSALDQLRNVTKGEFDKVEEGEPNIIVPEIIH